MATNPMQRKARNSFLLGMLLMLVITGCIIALLILQLKNYRDKEEAQKKASVNIYVLNADVKSGQIITSDMLVSKTVSRDLIPNDAIGDMATLDNYILEDKEGNTVFTEYDNNGNATLHITKDNRNYEVQQEEETENYYIMVNNEKQYIELNSAPVIAKISMNKNTVLTRGAVDKGESTTADDVRRQEYNVIVLPTQIQTGDYVDIRIAMPTGQDYIVISKKEVTIPEVGGVPSEDTIWMNLSEEEILSMNNAIVETFYTNGAKLYATIYTEAGIQTAATPTYPVSREVLTLINSDPNIIQKAKDALVQRYNVDQRNTINTIISNNSEENNDNVKTKVDESITNSKDNRKKYLDGLTSGTTTTTE